MTRFKKECIKKGFDYEEKYPCLPFTFKNGITLETIIYNAEKAQITSVYNVMVCKCKVNQDFSTTDISEV